MVPWTDHTGLALALQQSHYIYLNGVVLVSQTEIGIKRDGPAGDALSLPYYAATAWHHHVLSPELQAMALEEELLPLVEAFCIEELMPLLARGGFVDPAKRAAMAAQVAKYSGLSETAVLQHNLAVPPNFFWKELLR